MDSEVRKLSSSKFPPLLEEIADPPKVLYVRGALPQWDSFKFLCVIGSRKYSRYGQEACERLIEGLRGYPIVIVSGLALGIDSIAHKSALQSGLPTLAVPGSGLSDEVLYPASHRGLAHSIIDAGGALLSEFPPDFRATTWSFPQRNRIMAGLSHAILVVQAEKKSGTLITARLAADYNRDVLAVPGDIFSPGSEGPHYLLSNGARPITASADILDSLGLKTAETAAKSYDGCSEQEMAVISLLTESMPRDELIRALTLPVSDANTLLSAMELKGLIGESMGELRLL